MALSILAGLVLAQAPVATVDVAFADLSAGRNNAAISRIESNADLARTDPARLINLGVAYAREGRSDDARAMFRAAVRARDGVMLETATGQWVDSRDLARTALAMLDRGAFQNGAVFAAR